ncbi:MAG: hypothetical protein AB1631_25915 [Acidobacteriota bacterium]
MTEQDKKEIAELIEQELLSIISEAESRLFGTQDYEAARKVFQTFVETIRNRAARRASPPRTGRRRDVLP